LLSCLLLSIRRRLTGQAEILFHLAHLLCLLERNDLDRTVDLGRTSSGKCATISVMISLSSSGCQSIITFAISLASLMMSSPKTAV